MTNKEKGIRFIKKAKEKHGDKYEYTNVKYAHGAPVEIICKTHGSFMQRPTSHLNGHGCRKCNVSSRCNLNSKRPMTDFVEKANKIHLNKYDYSRVKYVDNKTKVEIICSEHGAFMQAPTSHLDAASGCPICAINKKKLTTSAFIERANIVHNFRYTYDKTEYINSLLKVIITCSKHGDFSQIPFSHLQGSGCRKCTFGGRLTTSSFIEKAKNKHGDKYIYDKVDYLDAKIKITITCPIHGDFTQTPNSHLAGRACPKCGRIKRLSYLYSNKKF
jgi:hypothetical protein